MSSPPVKPQPAPQPRYVQRGAYVSQRSPRWTVGDEAGSSHLATPEERAYVKAHPPARTPFSQPGRTPAPAPPSRPASEPKEPKELMGPPLPRKLLPGMVDPLTLKPVLPTRRVLVRPTAGPGDSGTSVMVEHDPNISPWRDAGKMVGWLIPGVTAAIEGHEQIYDQWQEAIAAGAVRRSPALAPAGSAERKAQEASLRRLQPLVEAYNGELTQNLYGRMFEDVVPGDGVSPVLPNSGTRPNLYLENGKRWNWKEFSAYLRQHGVERLTPWETQLLNSAINIRKIEWANKAGRDQEIATDVAVYLAGEIAGGLLTPIVRRGLLRARRGWKSLKAAAKTVETVEEVAPKLPGNPVRPRLWSEPAEASARKLARIFAPNKNNLQNVISNGLQEGLAYAMKEPDPKADEAIRRTLWGGTLGYLFDTGLHLGAKGWKRLRRAYHRAGVSADQEAERIFAAELHALRSEAGHAESAAVQSQVPSAGVIQPQRATPAAELHSGSQPGLKGRPEAPHPRPTPHGGTNSAQWTMHAGPEAVPYVEAPSHGRPAPSGRGLSGRAKVGHAPDPSAPPGSTPGVHPPETVPAGKPGLPEASPPPKGSTPELEITAPEQKPGAVGVSGETSFSATVRRSLARARNQAHARLATRQTQRAPVVLPRGRKGMRPGAIRNPAVELADLFDHAFIGATRLADGLLDKVVWEQRMLEKGGEELQPHLERLWEWAHRIYEGWTEGKIPKEGDGVLDAAREYLENDETRRQSVAAVQQWVQQGRSSAREVMDGLREQWGDQPSRVYEAALKEYRRQYGPLPHDHLPAATPESEGRFLQSAHGPEPHYGGKLQVAKNGKPLSPEERALEARSAARVEQDPDEVVRRYRQRFGNVLDVDQARELFPEYSASAEARTKYSNAVSRPARKVVDLVWDQMLREAREAGKPFNVVFTAGGPGSGKTYATDLALPRVKNSASIVRDSSLEDFADARAKIDDVLASGGVPQIVYVHRDLRSAVKGVVDRALDPEGGRIVTMGDVGEKHHAARVNIKKLKAHYGDRLSVIVIDNEGLEVTLVTDLPEVTYSTVQEAQEEAQNALRSERNQRAGTDKYVPEGTYQALGGTDAAGAVRTPGLSVLGRDASSGAGARERGATGETGPVTSSTPELPGDEGTSGSKLLSGAVVLGAGLAAGEQQRKPSGGNDRGGVLLARAVAVRGSLKHGPYVDGEGKKRTAKWYVVGAAPERRAERELMAEHLLRRRPEKGDRRWFIPGVGSGTLRELVVERGVVPAEVGNVYRQSPERWRSSGGLAPRVGVR